MTIDKQDMEMICQMSAILMQPLMTPTVIQNTRYVGCVVETAVEIYAKIKEQIAKTI